MNEYHVELAAGCYGGPYAPVVSRHRTLERALDRARQSDRLVAVGSGIRWQLDPQGDPKLGPGRYGNGVSRADARAMGWPI